MAKIIIKDSEISSSANIHFSGSITGESANFSSITNVTSINATTISGTTGQFGVLTASNGYVSDKLGVGTTSPNYTLSVTGTLGVSGNAVMSTITASNIQVDTITAREFYTQLVTSSVIYESGSTKFGDTQDDLHQFTGSIDITGSARTSNLIISQDAGSTVQPQIQFIGSASNPITLKVLDDNSLSFVNNGNNEVFHIDADLTGTIFSVTDGSGIPSIEVEDTGDITLAEFGGNVGVGTGSPSYKLDVSGTMRVTGASQFASVSGTLGQFNSLTVVNGSTTLAALSGTVGEFTTVSASIFTGSTGLLTALTASNVQITNLDVDTITAREYYTELVSSSIIYESGSTKFGDTSDDIHDFTGSVNIVSGNLMLGAPGENIDRTLTIHGSNTSNKLFYITQTIGGPVLGYSVANQNISFGTSVQPWQYINHYASTAHSFYIGSSEKVRIDSNGNVGIGTTSPSYQLDVDDSGSFGFLGVKKDFTANINSPYYKVIAHKDVLQNFNEWSNAAKIYDSIYTNRFLGKGNSNVFTITLNGSAANNTLKNVLTDGGYGGSEALGSAGDTGVVLNINFTSGSAHPPGAGIYGYTYAGGYIFVHFYAGRNPVSASFRYRYSANTGGTWSSPTDLIPFQQYGTYNGSPAYIGYYAPVSGVIYLTDFEFTFDARSDVSMAITEIEYHGSRMGMTEGGLITTQGGNIYRELGVGPGSVASPSLRRYDDTNTGIYFPANDQLGFSTVGTEKVRIDSNGNVGIGTTSPTHKVHINSTADNAYALRVQGNTNNASGVWTGIGISGENGNTKAAILFQDIGGSFSRGKLHLAVNNEVNQNSATPTDAKLTISNDGNVGIGTTSPGAKLDVSGSTIFGKLLTDTHQFTGSIDITGSARTSNLIISQDAGSTVQPKITYIGSSSSPIELKVLDDNTLSWEGSAGQLFSIANNLTGGVIFSVGDVSGIPLLEAEASGTVSMARYGTQVGIGTNQTTDTLTVSGGVDITGSLGVTGATNVTTISGTVGEFTEITASNLVINNGASIDGDTTITGFIRHGNNTIDLFDNMVFKAGYTQSNFNFRDASNNSLLYISQSGDVGIGTTSPGAKLDVNGTTNLRNDLTVTGSLLLSGSLHYVAGNVDISGTLSATAKSFDIEHPTKEGMRLVYGSLESPYHGVRLTGESCLTKGESKVFLPDYISSLCKQEDSSVQITNIKHGKVLWVEEINIEKNYFIIKADIEEHDNKLYNFFWSFTAIRKDIEDLVVEY